jgi:hypothetical protein
MLSLGTLWSVTCIVVGTLILAFAAGYLNLHSQAAPRDESQSRFKRH